jgi:hypothetical protein
MGWPGWVTDFIFNPAISVTISEIIFGDKNDEVCRCTCGGSGGARSDAL